MKNFYLKKSISNAFFSFAFLFLIQFSVSGQQSEIVFTANGTWEVLAGVTSIKILAWSAGGGGGAAINGAAGGGGGGAYSYKNFAVEPGKVFTIIVGKGGKGGVTSDNAGNGVDGGDTWVEYDGQILNNWKVLGGKAGSGSISLTGTVAGGTGGKASGVHNGSYNGGSGSLGNIGAIPPYGGGGGASAGTSGQGWASGSANYWNHGNGGLGFYQGGNGGDGGHYINGVILNPTSGQVPSADGKIGGGGGGGGALSKSSDAINGADGSDGKIIILLNPQITSFTPNIVCPAGGEIITFTGTYIQEGAQVWFPMGTGAGGNGGILVNGTYDLSNNTLQVVVPFGVTPGMPQIQNANTASSNNITDVLRVKNTWIGSTDNNWGNPKNWSDGVVPHSCDQGHSGNCPDCDVVVILYKYNNSYSAVKSPILRDTTVSVNNLIIKGASSTNRGVLEVGMDAKLQIAGTINQDNSAGIINAKSGTIEFNGTSGQSVSGNFFLDTTINNLIVSNPSWLNVASTGKPLAITNIISFANAGKLNTGDNITLKSTVSGTANLGQITSGSSVSGKLTVERYVNVGTGTGQHGKSWILLATPTGWDGNGQTIAQSWMEGKASNISGYGIYLPNNIGTGWDAGVTYAPSIKEYNTNSSSFISASGAGRDLYNEHGWMVFVRGDRNSKGTNDPLYNTTLRSKGIVRTGEVTLTAPAKAGGFVSFGNPYPSAVDLTKVQDESNGGEPPLNIYIWDPNVTLKSDGSSFGLGAYRTFTYVDGEYLLAGEDENNPYPDKNILRSGEAFFVQTKSEAYHITFNESSKGDLSTGTKENFRNMNSREKKTALLISVLYNSTGDVIDGTMQFFNDKFDNAVDLMDARKMNNGGINLSIKTYGELLAIERRQSIRYADTIFFNLAGITAGNYNLQFNALNLSAPGMEAWLEDAFTGQHTPMNLNGNTSVSFEVTSAAASKAVNRFSIVFKPAAPLPVTFVKIQAVNEGGSVNVKWAVANEINLNKYVVMKSIDGNNFSDLSDVVAKGQSNYSVIDANGSNGYNYYRICSVDRDGSVTYSEIVKVWLGSVHPLITVFPNPIVNGVINLKLENMPKGKYSVRLTNSVGQVILAQEIDHAGGNFTQKLPWNYNSARGTYNLGVNQPDGSTKVISILH